MLVGTVESGTRKLKVFMSDNASNTVGRFVAESGDDANFLLDGFAGELDKKNRSFTINPSNITIERLFKAKEKVVNGVDVSLPAQFKSYPSFKFFAMFFTIFRYAKDLATQSNPFSELSVGGDWESAISAVTTDIFKTPIGSGRVSKRLGSIVDLEFTSKDIRISISEDNTMETKKPYELRSLFGSNILIMESQGTAYKIVLNKIQRKRILGFKEVQQPLDLQGVSGSNFSPFYKTVDEVVAAHPDKNFAWIRDNIKKGKFKIVTNKSLVDDLTQIAEDYKVTQATSYDTETTGLEFNFKCLTGEGDRAVGFVLSAKPGTSYYFPLGHKKIENLCDGDVEYFIEKYLQPLMIKMRIITHNNYFDYRVSMRHGLDYNVYFDTMVFLNKTFRPKEGLSSSLKSATKVFLGRDAPELDDLCLNGDFNTVDATFADLPEELVRFYACPDADNTLSLFLLFKDNKIVDSFNAWQSTLNDSAFSSVVAYSQFYGMHLDMSSVPDLRKAKAQERREYHEELIQFIKDFAPSIDTNTYKTGSTQENLKIAYDILGYPVQISKKSGNPTLDKGAIKFLSKPTKPYVAPFTMSFDDVLLKLKKDGRKSFKHNLSLPIKDELVSPLQKELVYAFSKTLGLKTEFKINQETGEVDVKPEEDAPLYPFVSLLKKTRDIDRVFSNFLDKIPPYDDSGKAYFTNDGYCFPQIDAFKVTGRLSTKAPNIQGFDDLVKKEIKAREGYYMVDTDYASKENRVIAIMAQEDSLIEMFKDWRNDYHRFQAARLRGILQEQVTDALRKESKGLVFGINFGMSDESLGEVLFGSRSPQNTIKARQRKALFFSFQRKVEGWFDNNVRNAIKNGYSETVFGSRRYYNLATTSKSQVRRYALNHPIQGSAADIYKAGMVSLYNDIRRLGYQGKILITGFIHDEATIEVHKSIHPHIILGLIRKNMMVEREGWCPLDLGFGVGHSWYEAKKTEWQVGLQEKLENNLEAYDWDGDIDKYSTWAEEQIHQFNAEDTIQMLESREYEGQVFPVNYALELNKFLKVELSRGKNWVQAIKFVKEDLGIEAQVEELKDLQVQYKNSTGEEAKEIKTQYSRLGKHIKTIVQDCVSELHIRTRLQLLELFTGYTYDGLLDAFKDLSEIETQTKSTDDELQEAEQEKEMQRQLQLVKNQIVDFGLKYDMENNTLYLLKTKPFFDAFVKHLTKGTAISNEDKENYLSVVLYDFKSDKFSKIPTTTAMLHKNKLTEVQTLVMQFT